MEQWLRNLRCREGEGNADVEDGNPVYGGGGGRGVGDERLAGILGRTVGGEREGKRAARPRCTG